MKCYSINLVVKVLGKDIDQGEAIICALDDETVEQAFDRSYNSKPLGILYTSKGDPVEIDNGEALRRIMIQLGLVVDEPLMKHIRQSLDQKSE